MRRRIARATLLATCHLLLAVCAPAQTFYDVVHRPSHVRYDVLETEHFELIFQRGLDTLVYDAALTLERAYEQIRQATGLEREFRMPVVVNNFSDVSNGFVTAAPFRQEISAAPIKGKILSPRHPDWLSQVLPHETTHAVQAEVKAGFGVGTLLGIMSSDLERALNLGIPSGMTEGLAVLHESSEHDGSGRLNFSMTLMKYRAAAASGQPWKIGQVLDPPGYTRPFDRYYVGGGKLTEFLSDSVEADFFDRTLRFYNRLPFLGYGIALWYGTGGAPWALSEAFERTAVEQEEARLGNLGRLSDHSILTDQRGLACRRPKWIASTTILAHCAGYSHTPGFYTIDASSGRMEYAYGESITEDHFYNLNRPLGTIAFARYHPDLSVTISSKSNLHVLDLETGVKHKIADSERMYGPVQLDMDRLWALRDDGQFNQVVEVTSGGHTNLVFAEYGTLIRELGVSPAGDILALVNRAGEQAIYLFVEQTDGWRLSPLLASRGGAIYDPVWTPDARHIVFAADPASVSNLYVYSFDDDRVRQLTNVKFGALEPGVSGDGSKVTFSHYEHEQYQVAVTDLDIGSLRPVDGFGRPREVVRHFRPSDPGLRDSLATNVKPYRPFPSALVPRAIAPFVRFEEDRLDPFDEQLGLGLGLTLLGTDVLQQWAYSMTGFYQADRHWGRMTIGTGTNPLRPFVRLLNEPRTTEVTVDTTQVKISLEERSLRLGASLPLRISRNVDRTSIVLGLTGDYRRLRVIDSDSNPLTEFDDRVTLTPTVLFGYKLQSNIRDILPNSGVLISSTAELDVYTSDAARPARAWRSDLSWFLPLLKSGNRGIRLSTGVLWQNRGSILNVDSFLPRGYEDDVFLGGGTLLRAGVEVVQPVVYVDRGLVLLPISIEAVYLYGFAETLGATPDFDVTYSSVGLGVGVTTRLFHNLRVNARIAVSYRIEEDDWSVSFR